MHSCIEHALAPSIRHNRCRQLACRATLAGWRKRDAETRDLSVLNTFSDDQPATAAGDRLQQQADTAREAQETRTESEARRKRERESERETYAFLLLLRLGLQSYANEQLSPRLLLFLPVLRQTECHVDRPDSPCDNDSRCAEHRSWQDEGRELGKTSGQVSATHSFHLRDDRSMQAMPRKSSARKS